jgi:TetR/AcrR family transcriptional repressor of lmrAB and yxaGH operons
MSTTDTPTEAPGARERVLDSTITLLRRSGYSGAGINEILKESGAPKGSLYHYFPQGKRQIVGEAMALYAERVCAVFDEAMSKGDTPGDKVRRLFQLTAQRLEQSQYGQSCAGGSVALDLDAELESLRLAVSHFFEASVELFSRHLAFEDRRRARSFAGLLLTAIEGGYIRGRAEHSSRAFKEAAAWLSELADQEATR